jgi:hypothetical protein
MIRNCGDGADSFNRWDVTIAFLSRQEPRLPVSYLEALMTCDDNDSWSFFTLNGCPLEFVLAMARLAKLASIYEKTIRMEWTIFNDLPVLSETSEVMAFANPEAVSLDDVDALGFEENVDARRNRFHCIEAWRHAILLYVCRVFTQPQTFQNSRKAAHLARLILDSVRCIPSIDILQKQVLLPMFLAGAEMKSGPDRDFVRQYCKLWAEKSRAYHFESASELLEGIWSESDMLADEQYWWGVTVDSQHTNDGDTRPLSSQILLG